MATSRINNNAAPLTQPSLTPLNPTTAGRVKGAAEDIKVKGGDASKLMGGVDAGDGKNYDVQISSGGKSKAEAHAKALSIARNTPDIREDKVAALKKQIDAGTYEVDPAKVADGIAREAIRDHLAQSER